MEWRKHFSHFTEAELTEIRKKIHSSNFKLTLYGRNTIAYRNISEQEVSEAIKDGMIIEFHRKDGSNRVLIRYDKYGKTYSTCVVVNLDSGKIITAYRNRVDDNHGRLNQMLYSRKYNLLQYI